MLRSHPKTFKDDPLQLFQPNQLKMLWAQSPLQLKSCYIFQVELEQFRNRVLFAKRSDITIQLLGNVIIKKFLSKQESAHAGTTYKNNPCKTHRLSFHDYMLNLAPFFLLIGSPMHSKILPVSRVERSPTLYYIYFHCSFNSISTQHDSRLI